MKTASFPGDNFGTSLTLSPKKPSINKWKLSHLAAVPDPGVIHRLVDAAPLVPLHDDIGEGQGFPHQGPEHQDGSLALALEALENPHGSADVAGKSRIAELKDVEAGAIGDAAGVSAGVAGAGDTAAGAGVTTAGAGSSFLPQADRAAAAMTAASRTDLFMASP